MLRKQRVAAAAGITAFWLIMVALFLYREGGFSPKPEIAPGQTAFSPQDQWMGIYLSEGHRVGHLHMNTSEASRHGLAGYSMFLEVRLETSLFGNAARLDVNGRAWTAKAGNRSEFNFTLVSGEYRMGMVGTVAENRFRAQLETGGETIPLEFPVESALFPGGGLGMPTAGMPVLEPGETATIEAFDPMAMKVGQATIECVGTEAITLEGETYDTRVYTTTVGNITTRAWVTRDEEVIQATTPFGFTLRKISPRLLDRPIEVADQGDLIQSLAIISDGVAVRVGAARMKVRVSGIREETLPHDPPWQRREGNVLTILQPAPLPGPEAASFPAPDFDTAPFLKADAFITADHPEIIAKAAEIVGDESNPWKQSRLLYEWLFENVEKVPVLSVPQALDVLRHRKGDCNEHAVFFAALARSLGIPCRIAIGLVYSDTLGGFGYHAWPEVYCGEWYPMDPTLGQVVADATHIKLITGDIDKWIQLVGYVGQMELEVLEVE